MNDLIQTISSIVTGVAIPVLGIFLFYDAKKREASAKAGKAEADNITQYAAQWQKLYDEKVKHEEELNGKIDALYVQLNEQRDELARLKKGDSRTDCEAAVCGESKMHGVWLSQPSTSTTSVCKQ